jgi:hypothetical protein
VHGGLRVKRTQDQLSELLTPKQLADDLHVPERTLAKWRYLREEPAFIHVGRAFRYVRSDVERWLSAQKSGVT